MSSGVSAMPRMFDNEADTTAAGTLPCAIDVNAMDDCTVDGRQQMNNTPSASEGPSVAYASGASSSPSTGNSTYVLDSTARCRRQCARPANTASCDNRAPCRKKSAMIAALTSTSSAWAGSPEAGNNVASATQPINAHVKPSSPMRMTGLMPRGGDASAPARRGAALHRAPVFAADARRPPSSR